MNFSETDIPGLVIVTPELLCDDRGFFARSWCAREFGQQGLNNRLAQCNVSFNRHKGTVRGLHFQEAPHEEVKLVRCTMGEIYDVVLDLRVGSPTYLQHFSIAISSSNRKMVYVPAGCAHGFQTLAENSEVFYQMSEYHCPQSGAGYRWDDDAFGIAWPLEVSMISARDRSYEDFPRATQNC